MLVQQAASALLVISHDVGVAPVLCTWQVSALPDKQGLAAVLAAPRNLRRPSSFSTQPAMRLLSYRLQAAGSWAAHRQLSLTKQPGVLGSLSSPAQKLSEPTSPGLHNTHASDAHL